MVSYPTLILIMLAATLVVAHRMARVEPLALTETVRLRLSATHPGSPLCGALFSVQTYCSASALDRCDKRRSVTAFGHIIVQ